MAHDPLAMRMYFDSIDTDRSGHLNASELQRSLALGGLHYSPSEVHAFMRAFDSQGNNTLDFNEFTSLYSFLSRVHETFQRFDHDRSNSLAIHEVANAISQQGFQLDGPALQALIARHDPDASGSLSVAEFVRLCVFVQSASRAFQAFDPARTGKVELTFSQLVYAAAHLP